MSNEKEFFSRCVLEYQDGMYALAYGIVKNPEDAADVVQDAILKAYSNLDSLRDRKQFRPWIMRIVHNTAIEYLRKHRSTEDLDAHWDIAADTAGTDPETRLTVWEAIQQLRLPYRLVIILFYYENCTVSQISTITACPPSAIKQQLSRGRKMLATLLNKEDFLT